MPQFDSHFFSSLIFWELLSFGILFWVLYKFAFPPILQTLENRERKIKENLDQAEQNRAAAEQKLKEYEAKLQTAAKEVETIMSEAKQKAQRLLDENEQRLRAESQRIKEETTQDIERERRKAIQDIKNQTADLAILVAEKVIGRNLSDADQHRFAQEALAAIATQSKN
ncbi:MAG: F0F1 ATP synthase subunit B [Nitrospirota bacterium]|jgi:F-type H+-transporting ATPase subunit b|nr:F0F1 ATP synthase subunit B [Nitrospirota bacterium]MDH5575392.1 F0F1 ATP synthase subunit B [Nitrospirota bacterium]